MQIYRNILASCAIFLALLSGALQASAHATPISYEPEAEAILEVAPKAVRIIFSERVEPKASSITIFDPTGKEINPGSGTLDPLDSHIFWTSINSVIAEGTYAVSWQVVSADDGHFTRGAFIFSLGSAGGTYAAAHHINTLEIIHLSPWSEAFFIGLELLGQAIFWALLLLLPILHRLLSPNNSCQCRPGRFALLGILCVVIGTTGYIVLQSQALSFVQNTNFAQGVGTFIQTRSGSFAAFRGLLGIIFGLAFLVVNKKSRFIPNQNDSDDKSRILDPNKVGSGLHVPKFSRSHVMLAIVLLIAAYLRARISHAAASSVLPEFSIFVNFIHLVAKQTWIGGAVLAAVWILPLIKKLNRIPDIDVFSRIFSRLAAVAIGIGGVTGAYIIWLHLKGFDNVLTTDWGLRFIVLSALAGVFFATRLYQQYRNGRIFIIEALVGVAVLFTSSLLIITTPPLSSGQAFNKTVQISEGQIRLLDAPDGAPIFLLEISPSSGVSKVVVTANNSERGIGPLVIPTTLHHPGTYAFEKKHLSPPGNWKIDITAQRTSGYDIVGSFEFAYPADVMAVRQKLAEKSSGPFEGLVLVSVIALIIISRRLYKDATQVATN